MTFKAEREGIVIDTFDEPNNFRPGEPTVQVVCSVCPGTPVSSRFQAPSAIGGWRFMRAQGAPGRVEASAGSGFLALDTRNEVPPTDPRSFVVWDGADGNGLGGIDLTAGGDSFRVVVELVNQSLSILFLRVTDTMGRESSVSRGWDDLTIIEPNLFPFSSLAGDADLLAADQSGVGESLQPVDAAAQAGHVGPLVADLDLARQ